MQVSHDLREVAPLVDNAWSMRLGGTMEKVAWPPSKEGFNDMVFPSESNTAGAANQAENLR